jgi:radical SAM superfamily enzyme YgiQ (UPF0313 family)
MPEYELLEGKLDRYRINLSSTRGCPGKCSFCAGSSLWEGVRSQSVSSVIKELDYLAERLPRGHLVHFCDTTVSFPRERFLALVHQMHTRKYTLQFSCDIRADHVDEEVAAGLEAAGFRRICVGVEDVSCFSRKRTADLAGKGIAIMPAPPL